ncbi:DUF6998 domain-containing protein [Curtobacterium sp. BRD11]|uniref:DUF6998 domain-containing protein n=1 Tax=Curtobacterium sp. BRD11 TaxID=2962581 RepID=UPI0028814E4B|nr:hypothetical protein [Curtobacterium sp. BRD11]MDT0209020.1 hypothetical protein [Curtobacterium sp. BRD11]
MSESWSELKGLPLRVLMSRRQEHLAAIADIETALRGRGVSRTGNLIGEIGERLALDVYGGELVAVSAKSIDLVDAAGRRLQGKVRELPAGDRRIFQFGDDELDFDQAICIRFDRATFRLEWAREIPREEVQRLSSAHAAGPRLTTTRAAFAGTDVSAQFARAWDALQETL